MAKTIAVLDHPNLPKVHDYFSDEGNEYLVMDYVEGENLESILQKYKKNEDFLPEELVRLWISQMLDALAYLHSQPHPIIHRDIKPANIILSQQDKVKLVDFGLVKLLEPTAPRTATIMKGMGTPAYTPLEQYANEKAHTDARSDIYALGATLYHLLTAVMPPDIHQRLLEPTTLARPRQHNPLLSSEIEGIILKAMAIYPDERFQSASAFRDALESGALPDTLPVVEQPVYPERPLPRAMTVVMGLLLLLLLGGGLATWSFGSPSSINLPLPKSSLNAELTGRILFISEPINTNGEGWLYAMNADGSDLVYLSSTITGWTGAWSPDGEQIAFESDRNGNSEIFVMNADGGGLTNLSNSSSNESFPSWSPDGTQIVFGSDRDGERNIYVMNADGSEQVRLTDDPAHEDMPSWSPDGQHIAFVSFHNDSTNIVTITPDGSQIQLLKEAQGISFPPAWSPDGRQLAFSAWVSNQGRWDILVMNADGGNLTDLTSSTNGYSFAPVWSPDGKQIMLAADYDLSEDSEDDLDIYVMDSDGSNLRLIIKNKDFESPVDWKP